MTPKLILFGFLIFSSGLVGSEVDDPLFCLNQCKAAGASYDPRPTQLDDKLDRHIVMNDYWKKVEHKSMADKKEAFSSFPGTRLDYWCFTEDVWCTLRRNFAAALHIGIKPSYIADFFEGAFLKAALQFNDIFFVKLFLGKLPETPEMAGHIKTVAMAQLFLQHGMKMNISTGNYNAMHHVISLEYEPALIGLYAAHGVNKNDRNERDLTPFLTFSRRYTEYLHFNKQMSEKKKTRNRALFLEFAKLGLSKEELEEGRKIIVKEAIDWDLDDSRCLAQWDEDCEWALTNQAIGKAAKDLKKKKLTGLTNQHLVELYAKKLNV